MYSRFIYMGFEELVVSMRYELDFLKVSHNYNIQALSVNP